MSNNMVVVPNAVLASATITNYCQPMEEMSVPMGLGVAYGSDLNKVETVTIEVAKEVMREVQGGVPGFEPFIRYHTFGDSSIDFNVILRAKEFADQYLIRHEFIKRLQARYEREGIEIPFPIRTVRMAKEKAES
jgi:small-conductance mechanosensitive channel